MQLELAFESLPTCRKQITPTLAWHSHARYPTPRSEQETNPTKYYSARTLRVALFHRCTTSVDPCTRLHLQQRWPNNYPDTETLRILSTGYFSPSLLVTRLDRMDCFRLLTCSFVRPVRQFTAVTTMSSSFPLNDLLMYSTHLPMCDPRVERCMFLPSPLSIPRLRLLQH